MYTKNAGGHMTCVKIISYFVASHPAQKQTDAAAAQQEQDVMMITKCTCKIYKLARCYWKLERSWLLLIALGLDVLIVLLLLRCVQLLKLLYLRLGDLFPGCVVGGKALGGKSECMKQNLSKSRVRESRLIDR